MCGAWCCPALARAVVVGGREFRGGWPGRDGQGEGGGERVATLLPPSPMGDKY